MTKGIRRGGMEKDLAGWIIDNLIPGFTIVITSPTSLFINEQIDLIVPLISKP